MLKIMPVRTSAHSGLCHRHSNGATRMRRKSAILNRPVLLGRDCTCSTCLVKWESRQQGLLLF